MVLLESGIQQARCWWVRGPCCSPTQSARTGVNIIPEDHHSLYRSTLAFFTQELEHKAMQELGHGDMNFGDTGILIHDRSGCSLGYFNLSKGTL